jgi:hypothetical protein
MWQAVVQIAAAEAQFNKIVTNPTEWHKTNEQKKIRLHEHQGL